MAVPFEPRLLLTRFVVGSGIEIGPGHVPFPLPFGGASTRYVDRWEPEDNRALFPELGDAGSGFVRPDIVADLDTDRLAAITDASQDYVIASHVLEHLAEPLGQLADIHRVLRPGGVVLILLPDRRHTFDRDRPPTALAHLVDEHRRGVVTVGDEHIEEFLRATGGWDDGWDEAARREAFDLHRRRSIHVHTWAQQEFPEVLAHTILEMGMRWDLEDAIFVEDVADGFEFAMVLRRSVSELPPDVLARRLADSWAHLMLRSQAAQEGRAHAAANAARLDRLRRLPGFAVARRLSRLRWHVR